MHCLEHALRGTNNCVSLLALVYTRVACLDRFARDGEEIEQPASIPFLGGGLFAAKQQCA
jgi:hypothetical protein